jgi:hypothetical protein
MNLTTAADTVTDALMLCLCIGRLEFYHATFSHKVWVQEFETFGDYTQGNKRDSTASGAVVSAVLFLIESSQTVAARKAEAARL